MFDNFWKVMNQFQRRFSKEELGNEIKQRSAIITFIFPLPRRKKLFLFCFSLNGGCGCGPAALIRYWLEIGRKCILQQQSLLRFPIEAKNYKTLLCGMAKRLKQVPTLITLPSEEKWPFGGRWYAPKCVTPGVTARGLSISITNQTPSE